MFMAQVTHLQIAKRAGVSRSLVSMALKGSGRVDKNTRKKIEIIARELGYRPNMLVKGIQTGRTMTVGVVIRAQRAFFGEMLSGVQDTLEEHDYLPVALSVSKRLSLIEQITRLIDQRVDGLIIKPEGEIAASAFKKLLKYNIPIVTVDNYIEGINNIDFAGSDDEAAGRLAAGHLIELGHRNMAVVSVKGRPHLSVRAASFRRTVEAVPGGKCSVIEAGQFDEVWRWRELVEIIRPSAVFFVADTMAGDFINIACQHGVRIPEDISVIGSANMELGRYTVPQLTTLEQYPYKIGCNAAKLLISRMLNEEKTAGNRQVLEMPGMILRQSTASVKK